MSRARLAGRLVRLALRSPAATGPLTVRRLLLLLGFVPAYLLLQLAHWTGFLLDDILFRGYRDVRVREPLFVVGLPRSGTSFLQQVLADDRERFTTLRLWELLLAPSVTERRVWRGVGRLDRALGRPAERLFRGVERLAFGFMEEVHPVRLHGPEEDYFLLLPVFACFLLVVPFPDHDDVWELARFDELPRGEREALVEFYRSCVQRHLYVAGEDRRLLSKNPSFTPMVRSLAGAFPDARFICCVRDPREGVPSLLSSLEAGARAFGWEVADPPRRDRFVEMLAYFGEHALSALPEVAPGRHVFLPLERMARDVEGAVLHAYDELGLEAGPAFRRALRRRAERARDYRSSHEHGLARYGLQESEVRERFRHLMEAFGWDRSPATAPARGAP